MLPGCFPRGALPAPAAIAPNRKAQQQRLRLPEQLGARQRRSEGGSAGALSGWRSRRRGPRLEALPDGCSGGECAAQDPSSSLVLSRRNLLAGIAAGACVAPSGMAQAYPVADLGDDGAATRRQLLDCINAGGAEEDVQEAIRLLAPFNPTPSLGQSLQGNWKLLWSSDAAEVTKVVMEHAARWLHANVLDSLTVPIKGQNLPFRPLLMSCTIPRLYVHNVGHPQLACAVREHAADRRGGRKGTARRRAPLGTSCKPGEGPIRLGS